MRIGIDIDDTLSYSSETFIKYAIKYNNINNVRHKIDTTTLDTFKSFGWTKDEELDFKEKYLEKILRETSVKENAVLYLNLLKKDNNEIYLISSRNEKELKNIFEVTIDWLKKNKIPYDELILNCNNKAKACFEKKIDCFIDDNYKICSHLYNCVDIPVYMFSTNYNNFKYDEDIKTVKSWDEIYSYIKNIKINHSLRYKEFDSIECFSDEPDGFRYILFYQANGKYRGYLVPDYVSRSDFMENYSEYIPEHNLPIYENNGIVLRMDPKYPCPGFYILSLNKTYKAFDLMDDITFIRFSYILKKVKEGMRKALNINYAHLLSNEKSDPYVNVHFWLVPVNGTTSPDLLDFDIKKYLESFKASEEIDKIIDYNKKLKEYFVNIDLVSLDNRLLSTLERNLE